MSDDDGRLRASNRVSDEMVEQSLGVYELARRAGIDPATLTDFLAGKRWPQVGNRKKIASALGWPDAGIDMIARGEDFDDQNETVTGRPQDGGVLLSMPPEALEGLSPADREEVITAAKLSALQTARAIRRRLDDEAADR